MMYATFLTYQEMLPGFSPAMQQRMNRDRLCPTVHCISLGIFRSKRLSWIAEIECGP